MNIEIITMWYNEAFFVPYFMKHYSYADHIHIVIDADTNDGCDEMAKKYPNTTIEYFKFPDMNDEQIRIAKMNSLYANSRADWVIAPDADEFIFRKNMHQYLSKQTCDIIFVRFFQVYRHITDTDLNPKKPVWGQRMHGDPEVVSGSNRRGLKPIVVKTGVERLKWTPGFHKIWNRHKYITSNKALLGQHWTLADPCFCVERRVSRCNRQSQNNLKNGMDYHNNGVTVENVLAECKAHENDNYIKEFRSGKCINLA